jgi:hypothetical protein
MQMSASIRAFLLALAAFAAGMTAAAAQYGPPEQIGQGGRGVPTPNGNNYNSLNPNSSNYVPPAQTSPFVRPRVTPQGTVQGYQYPSQRKR